MSIKSIPHNFLNFFTHQDEKTTIAILYQNQELILSNIIALSRLLFIKPSDLKRESQNTEANTDYIKKYVG